MNQRIWDFTVRLYPNNIRNYISKFLSMRLFLYELNKEEAQLSMKKPTSVQLYTKKDRQLRIIWSARGGSLQKRAP